MKGLLFSGARVEGVFANLGLFVSRVALGLGLAIGHGFAKIPGAEGHGAFLRNVEGLWAAHDLPAATTFAYAAIFAEVVCGFLLAGGLLTRIASLFIVVNMGVAAFLVHQMDPIFMGGGAAKEPALLYMAGALVFLCLGAGRLSLDSFLTRD